jgi:nucleoside-diphosphate-sugar epimerase
LSERLGFSLAWARLFFVYGPGENPDRLVPSVARALLRGEAAPCSEGSQVRDFLHVDDAAWALVRLLESEVEGPVNIASGRPVGLRELLLSIGEAVGTPGLLEFGKVPLRPGEPPLLVADVRRLANEVGWEQRWTLQTGITETVEWWRDALRQERDKVRDV